MALITCPNCGKNISDKAKVCPGCGCELTSDFQVSEYERKIMCEDCSAEISADDAVCPNCGCPVPPKENVQTPQKVEVTSVNLSSVKQKSKKILVGIAIVVVLAIVISLIVSMVNKNKAIAVAKEYYDNLSLASHTMLLGASEAESAGNLIRSVWYNSIHEERDPSTDKYTQISGLGYFYDDFNDALSNLFSDSNFKATISSIEENQNTVNALMKELNNPPEEYEDAYVVLKDYYDAYIKLTHLATNPTGSLSTFSNNFSSADTEVVNQYEKMKLYLD